MTKKFTMNYSHIYRFICFYQFIFL